MSDADLRALRRKALGGDERALDRLIAASIRTAGSLRSCYWCEKFETSDDEKLLEHERKCCGGTGWEAGPDGAMTNRAREWAASRYEAQGTEAAREVADQIRARPGYHIPPLGRMGARSRKQPKVAIVDVPARDVLHRGDLVERGRSPLDTLLGAEQHLPAGEIFFFYGVGVVFDAGADAASAAAVWNSGRLEIQAVDRPLWSWPVRLLCQDPRDLATGTPPALPARPAQSVRVARMPFGFQPLDQHRVRLLTDEPHGLQQAIERPVRLAVVLYGISVVGIAG